VPFIVIVEQFRGGDKIIAFGGGILKEAIEIAGLNFRPERPRQRS